MTTIKQSCDGLVAIGRRRGILDAIAYLVAARREAHAAGDIRTHAAAVWAADALHAWYDSTEAQSDAAIDAVLEGVTCGD